MRYVMRNSELGSNNASVFCYTVTSSIHGHEKIFHDVKTLIFENEK